MAKAKNIAIGLFAALLIVTGGDRTAVSFVLGDGVPEAWAAAGLGEKGAGDGGAALSRIEEDLNEAYKARDAQNWVQESQDSARERRLNDIKKEALRALGQSEASDLLKAIDRIQADIAGQRRQAAELAGRRAVAPERAPEGSGLLGSMFGPKVKSDYDREIEQIGREIAESQAEIDSEKERFIAALSDVGVTVDRQTVDGLLQTVTAADMVQLQVVYQMLYKVHGSLAEAIEASGEAIDVARRYYGYHAVVLEMAVFMHEDFMQSTQTHRHRIREIKREALDLKQSTNALLRKAKGAQKSALEANLRSQDLTIRAAQIYDDYLAEQIEEVGRAHRRLKEEHSVAVNTVRTVALAGELVMLIRSQTGSFEALRNIEVPKLRPFENKALEEEFRSLTEKLRVPAS